MSDTYPRALNLVKPAINSSNNAWGTKLNDNLDKIDVATGVAPLFSINTSTWKRAGRDIPLGQRVMLYGDGARALVLPDQRGATGTDIIPLGTIIEVIRVNWNGPARIEPENYASGGVIIRGRANDGAFAVNHGSNPIWILDNGWVRLMAYEPNVWVASGSRRNSEGS